MWSSVKPFFYPVFTSVSCRASPSIVIRWVGSYDVVFLVGRRRKEAEEHTAMIESQLSELQVELRTVREVRIWQEPF